MGRLENPGGESLQEALLRAGLAVLSRPDAPPALLAAEAQARTARRGLWAGGGFPMTTEETDFREGFATVTFTVHRADMAAGYLYLNTEEDWRRDFTVRVAEDDLTAIFGGEVPALAGCTLEVRGHLFFYGGQMIEVAPGNGGLGIAPDSGHAEWRPVRDIMPAGGEHSCRTP